MVGWLHNCTNEQVYVILIKWVYYGLYYICDILVKNNDGRIIKFEQHITTNIPKNKESKVSYEITDL